MTMMKVTCQCVHFVITVKQNRSLLIIIIGKVIIDSDGSVLNQWNLNNMLW